MGGGGEVCEVILDGPRCLFFYFVHSYKRISISYINFNSLQLISICHIFHIAFLLHVQFTAEQTLTALYYLNGLSTL